MPKTITPLWKILILMSMLGLALSYQGTTKIDQTTYVISYQLRNGYLTTVRISGGHMDIVDPKGIRVAYADILEPVEISPGQQSTLRINVKLAEPLRVLTARYSSETRVTFRGHVMYETGWLSWLFGSGKLEFEESAPLSTILEYLGLYGIND